jgi:hypothetical protein
MAHGCTLSELKENSLILAAIFDLSVKLSFGALLFFGLALVVFTLTLDDAKFDFEILALEINLQGDEGVTLFEYLPLNLSDLGAIQEQFANAAFVDVGVAAITVGANAHRVKEHLALVDTREGITQIDMPFSDGFYLGAEKRYARFISLDDMIVMPGFAILSDDLHGSVGLHDPLK